MKETNIMARTLNQFGIDNTLTKRWQDPIRDNENKKNLRKEIVGMTIKVFIEYNIVTEKRDSFIALVPELKRHADEQGASQYQIYEGTDQPGLIVEEFLLQDIGWYHMIKMQRLDSDSPFWAKLHDHILGGAGKLHIWAFRGLLQP